MSEIKKHLNYIKSFGVFIFIIGFLGRLMRKFSLPQIILDKYDNFKHIIVERWLEKHIAFTESELHIQTSRDGMKTFVFWWQGIENAPDIVKICIKTIYEHSPLEVILLSKDNYLDYIVLPEYIIEKMQTGKMSLAHFSDVLRFYLLFNYGGFWIDATDFLTKSIPKEIFDYDFYSIKGAYAPPGLGWDWTSWFMFGKKGNLLSQEMVKFYNYYWLHYDIAITYLFLDCYITLLKKHNEKIASLVDRIPYVGKGCFWLQKYLNNKCNKQLINDLAEKAVFVQKLTYKESLIEDDSFYSVLKKRYLS